MLLRVRDIAVDRLSRWRNSSSAMYTTRSISASTASRIAFAAKGGDVDRRGVRAGSRPWPSHDGVKHGQTQVLVPPFFGVTPPTICVPYAMACSPWNVPFLPVKPWTITLVFLSTNTAGSEANPRAPLRS